LTTKGFFDILIVGGKMEKTTAKVLQLPSLKDLITEQDETEIFDFVEFPYLKPKLEVA
jgi:hypothetical protein|tara:strand:+ start:281 stop:454 length:174 start_codon:yes stop_codon:yes gene_type:complete